MQNTAIKYLTISFLLSLAIVLFNVFSSTGNIHDLGHGTKIIFWLTIGPGVSMLIGGIARQWLIPDVISTREGAVGIFKAKVFWSVGPQFIGWLLGLLAVSEQLY